MNSSSEIVAQSAMAVPFVLEAVERDRSKTAITLHAERQHRSRRPTALVSARAATIRTKTIEDVIWLALGFCTLAVLALSFWI